MKLRRMLCLAVSAEFLYEFIVIQYTNKSVSVMKEAVQNIVEELDQCPAVRENQIENEKKN